MRKLIFIFSSLIYKLFSLIPINKDRIIMECDYGKGFYGNLLYIYKEIEKRNLTVEIIIPLNKGITIDVNNVKVVKTRTPLHLYYLATSKYWITNNHYYHFLKKRNGTIMINTWHAMGAFKRFGIDSAKSEEEINRFERDSKNIDYLLVSSSELRSIYSKALNVDENKILSMGIPRTDVLINEEEIEKARIRFYNKYPSLKDKKLILYAPTFRDDEKEYFNMQLNLKLLKNNFGDNYKFIFKLHPIIRNSYEIDDEVKDFVIDMGKENINDLMIVSNCLITDYSSVIFEYSLLKKPMAFFTYDFHKYKEELRNFYFHFEDFIPGEMMNTTEEIVTFINNAAMGDFDIDRINSFSSRFCEYKDGEASKRFVDYFLNF